jgi:hypothetical protein
MSVFLKAKSIQITPGFGGRVYFPTGKGFIVLQVLPKPSSLSSK